MKIFVAIPHTGNLRAELVTALMRLQSKKHEHTIYLSHKSPHDCNRNHIVSVFLKSDADYLLMIDSDIEPPINIIDMADNDKDICSGSIATNKGAEIIPLALTKTKEGYRCEGVKHGLNKIDATGTGCMMIKRSVFDKLKKPYFSFVYDKEGILVNGEDFNFCDCAVKAGLDIYFDSRYVCKHYQTYPLTV